MVYDTTKCLHVQTKHQSVSWNQILRTNFKKDLQRNIHAKFGPNWPSGLEGEDI